MPIGEEGRKDDKDKTRYDLLPPHALEYLAQVFTVGAEKYGERNWEKGITWGRIFGAIMRHLWAFWRGENLDKETKIPHLAHAACGCFMLLTYLSTRTEFDDRFK